MKWLIESEKWKMHEIVDHFYPSSNCGSFLPLQPSLPLCVWTQEAALDECVALREGLIHQEIPLNPERQVTAFIMAALKDQCVELGGI